MQNRRLRDALFTLADSRGNNPHGTTETSEHESRRLNAGRYETVEQIDRALDVRARDVQSRRAAHNGARLVRRQLGDVELPPHINPPKGGSLLGSALLIALGAGLMYLITRPDTDMDEGDYDVPPEPIKNPEAATAPVAPVSVVMVPPHHAPPIVVPPPIVTNAAPAKSRRKSRRKKVAEVTTTSTVVVEPLKT